MSYLLCPHCRLALPGLADSSVKQTNGNVNTDGQHISLKYGLMISYMIIQKKGGTIHYPIIHSNVNVNKYVGLISDISELAGDSRFSQDALFQCQHTRHLSTSDVT